MKPLIFVLVGLFGFSLPAQENFQSQCSAISKILSNAVAKVKNPNQYSVLLKNSREACSKAKSGSDYEKAMYTAFNKAFYICAPKGSIGQLTGAACQPIADANTDIHLMVYSPHSDDPVGSSDPTLTRIADSPNP